MEKPNSETPFRVQILWAALAGIALGLPFPFAQVWPLSFLGVALLIYVVITAKKARHAALLGLVAGLVYYGLVFMGPLVGIFPFDWYGIEHPFLQFLAVSVSLLYVSLSCTLSIVLFAILLWYLKSRSWFDVILVPSLWVMCEWIGSYLYFFFLYGEGSFFGPHFTMGFVGYVLASDSVLLQTAFFGGVYVLSFIVVFVGAFLVYVSAFKRKRHIALGVGILFCAWAALHGVYELQKYNHMQQDTEVLTVAVVSRYMPPTLVQSSEFITERYTELLSLIAPLQGIDLLVFPENTTFLRSLRFSDDVDKALVRSIGRDAYGPVIIDSEDFMEEDSVVHATVWFEKNGAASIGSKQFLIAFGEYVPTLYAFILKLLPHTNDVILEDRQYVPGIDIPQHVIGGIKVAVRLCDEVMSPELYRTQVRDGAEVLVNISSLSWFHGSPAVHSQMQRMAKVRAVESDRFLIQSSNMSPAYILDQKGSVVAQTQWNDPEVLKYDVPSRTNSTPYIFLGQWVLLVFGLIVGIGGIRTWAVRE